MKVRAFCAAVSTVVVSVAMLLTAAEASTDRGFTAVADTIAGSSPDSLGTWTVHYQRVGGGDPVIADAINDVIDAEARGQVATDEPCATKTHAWTFNSTGTLSVRPNTVSALFVGEDDTDMPNMAFHAVATRVFDARSGILIDWDNLFTDKRAGLTRLSEQTRSILPTVYRAPCTGVWQFGNEIRADRRQLQILVAHRARHRAAFPGLPVRPWTAGDHRAVDGRR